MLQPMLLCVYAALGCVCVEYAEQGNAVQVPAADRGVYKPLVLR